MAGKPKAFPMTPDRARYKLWRSIRVLTRTQGSFDYAALQATAAAGKKNVQVYVQALANAGYISTVAMQRGPNHHKRFALIRDTGPLAPRIMRDRVTVFDANLKTLAEPRGAAERAGESASCVKNLSQAEPSLRAAAKKGVS
jgi:hypothetical protein